MISYKCKMDGSYYKIFIHRTNIQIKNLNNNYIIGFFDIINYKIIKGQLFIHYKPDIEIFITGVYIINIYNNITQYMNNLRYDVNINNLIIDNNIVPTDFICMICLENKKKSDIIQLKCCKNFLHYNCYLNYLKKSKNRVCPICRNSECPLCMGKGC